MVCKSVTEIKDHSKNFPNVSRICQYQMEICPKGCLVCLLMKITACFISYTGHLYFIIDPINHVLLILVHALLKSCL